MHTFTYDHMHDSTGMRVPCNYYAVYNIVKTTIGIDIYLSAYAYTDVRIGVYVISSKPLNPHMHLYTNMRSLLGSEGCFLRTSIVVSNCVINLYTQIRIYLYVSWAEWVGPLRYSLIRSYWLSQAGQSAQNRSVPAYYNKQLLPSWTETPLWDFVWLRIGWWVTYHTSPSVYGAFSISACIYDWRGTMV